MRYDPPGCDCGTFNEERRTRCPVCHHLKCYDCSPARGFTLQDGTRCCRQCHDREVQARFFKLQEVVK